MDYLQEVHTGLVIGTQPEGETRAYVIDLRYLMETGIPIAKSVDDMAFRPPIDVLTKPEFNNEYNYKRREERRYNRDLNFGDVITWKRRDEIEKYRGVYVITNFDRISNKSVQIFTSRVSPEGDCQILLDGIINPADQAHIYTQYFRSIAIPEEQRGNAWPNIYYETWITIDVNPWGDLQVKFGAFHEVCPPDKQVDVGAAPWNRESTKYAITCCYDDSSTDDEELGGLGRVWNNKTKGKQREMEIYGREATPTSYRSMIIWDHPECFAVLPLKMNITPGQYYSVDAYWNSFENRYMVSKIHPSRRNSTCLPAVPSGKLRISVRQNENILGLFENETYGLIDDPKGVLAFLSLSKFAKNAIPVVITDSQPSRGGQIRFRIDDIHGDKKEKLNEWKRTGEIKVENVSGVVIDHDHVFSSTHYPLFFAFSPMADVPDVGSHVKFSAIYMPEVEEFRITQYRLDTTAKPMPFVQRKMDVFRPRDTQFIFRVSGRRPVHKKLDEILYSTEFGLLDDNLELVNFDEKQMGKTHTVWVMRSLFNAEEDKNEPRTVYQVVGVGDEPPNSRVEEKKRELNPIEKELTELQKQFIQMGLKSDRSGAATPSNSSLSISDRFSAPVIKEGRPSSSSSQLISMAPSPAPSTVSTIADQAPPGLPSPSASTRAIFSPSATSGMEPSPTPSDHSSFTSSYESCVSPAPSSSHSSVHSTPCPTRPSSVAAQPVPPGRGLGLFASKAAQSRSESRASQGTDGRATPSKKGLFATAAMKQQEESGRSSRATEASSNYSYSDNSSFEKYKGPILMPPGANHKFDLMKTMQSLKQNVMHHKRCGTHCIIGCKWLAEILILMKDEEFWEETKRIYPDIHDNLGKIILNATREGEADDHDEEAQ